MFNHTSLYNTKLYAETLGKYSTTTPLVEFNRILQTLEVSSLENKYDKLLEKIADNIKRIRKSKKLSQNDMTEFGFDLRNYQRLEAGKHSPSLYTIHKLSFSFKVDINEFFK